MLSWHLLPLAISFPLMNIFICVHKPLSLLTTLKYIKGQKSIFVFEERFVTSLTKILLIFLAPSKICLKLPIYIIILYSLISEWI